jgi:type I site-specific restriction endonuclease
VQHLQGSQVDTSARVVICTIQRMFSLLKGKELPPEADEESTEGLESLFKDPEPLRYNPAFPIELFDIVVTDEAHRSIYNLWRQVLEYYDAYLVGLTATPNKQTFGFFNQNLVMEYGHTQAVADGVNDSFDAYIADLKFITFLSLKVVKQSPRPIAIRSSSLAQCDFRRTTFVNRRGFIRKFKTMPSNRKNKYGTL